MNVLVTGCAGFIGQRVCRLLLEQGHSVVGADNINDAYDVRLKEYRLGKLLGSPNFEFHRVDISQAASLPQLFENRPDAVINLAARAGVRESVRNPIAYFETNAIGTLNLLEMCRALGVGKFVLSSTSSLYGVQRGDAFLESTSTDRPLSPYAASKKAAEALTYTYHYLHGIDISVFRYFTVYGPAGRPDMSIFRFIKWISEGEQVEVFGDGLQERDFTYVDDIAQGTVAGMESLGYEVINLGGDNPASILSVIGQLELLLGAKASIKFSASDPSDVRATWADITKANAMLGWSPQVSLEEGLRRTVRWYSENRDWCRTIELG